MSAYFFLDPAGVRRVTQLFDLPATGAEQDWELELANPARCGEFLAALAAGGLAADAGAEAALAALFIASADAAMDTGAFGRREDEAACAFFKARPRLRESMRRLWFQRGEPMHADRIAAWLKPADGGRA